MGDKCKVLLDAGCKWWHRGWGAGRQVAGVFWGVFFIFGGDRGPDHWYQTPHWDKNVQDDFQDLISSSFLCVLVSMWLCVSVRVCVNLRGEALVISLNLHVNGDISLHACQGPAGAPPPSPPRCQGKVNQGPAAAQLSVPCTLLGQHFHYAHLHCFLMNWLANTQRERKRKGVCVREEEEALISTQPRQVGSRLYPSFCLSI